MIINKHTYIQKIVKHVDTSSDGLSGLEDATDPTAFEALADLMEDLLDDVESHLRGEKGSNNHAQVSVYVCG